ncbi:MAG: phosphoribosyl-ATP diphosphatase [Phycisphaerales bacterium]|nr:phosphoribosyl-ATP diphosphatase [Phycisphaerales bacterium]
MITPSIDLMGGQAVQLVGGREKALDAGDPRTIAERFGVAGDLAVIDLDAALGSKGGALRENNADLVRALVRMTPCRVGGGVRSVEKAVQWLDAGAVKVILGTAATPEVLRELPRDRVVAALDAVHDDVVVEGWRKPTGRPVLERVKELSELVSGFLVTFVEREGRMVGIEADRIGKLVDTCRACGVTDVTVAGGVRSAAEVAQIDRLGAHAQVGMALYTGAMDLGEAFAAPLKSDRADGLIPTVVCDEHGLALGLAYSSRETLAEAVRTRRGVYHSRARGRWVKGESSGATQELLRVDADCDRDAVRFTVRQSGPGFCHRDTRTCWGDRGGRGEGGLAALDRLLRARRDEAPDGSYTRRLFDDPALLRAKLLEEAAELAEARAPHHVAEEAADLIYFALARSAAAGVRLEDIGRVLDLRSMKLTRRKGDAKPGPATGTAPRTPREDLT